MIFPSSCSATVLNASPSAHDQSAAALRRPPARHLAAALCLFLEALLFAQSPPNRWISRVGKNIAENTPRGKLDALHKPDVNHRGNFAVAYFRLQELDAVCAVAAFSPQIRANGSRDQNGAKLEVLWEH